MYDYESVFDYKNVFACNNVLINTFFRKVIDAIITFPPGIYHFIISADSGNILV